MQEVMGKQYPDDEDEFQELLQNGVELCNLANTILPDSIKRVGRKEGRKEMCVTSRFVRVLPFSRERM